MSAAAAVNATMAHGSGWIGPDWPAVPGVRAVVTTRRLPGRSVPPFDAFNLGARCGDDPATVAANRRALTEWLVLPSEPSWLRQVHGNAVHETDTPTVQEPEADAAVTRARGVVLAILTADCLPILFCADDGSVVAAAHAGWRGLAKALSKRRWSAWRCPPHASTRGWGRRLWRDPMKSATRCARRSSGATRTQRARSRRPVPDTGNATCMRSRGGGLRQLEFPPSFSDARFYSYRRERETGRFATLIWRTHATS